MKTATLFSVFVFLVSLSLVGSFFSVQGLNQDLPSAEALASGNPAAFASLLTGLIPSPTGVLWFDLFIYGGFSLMIGVAGLKFIRGIS